MGEAKRRKLLGLMPAETRFPFSVKRGLGPIWTEQPPPAELVAEVTRTIGEILGNTPGSWDSQSRTLALQHAEHEYRVVGLRLTPSWCPVWCAAWPCW